MRVEVWWVDVLVGANEVWWVDVLVGAKTSPRCQSIPTNLPISVKFQVLCLSPYLYDYSVMAHSKHKTNVSKTK